MSAVFDKPSLRQRVAPMLQGFDGPLAFAVILLGVAGLLTMYSSGFDHGTRFVDHARNMTLAAFIMFVVAQIPPQRLMSLAIPLYVTHASRDDSKRASTNLGRALAGWRTAADHCESAITDALALLRAETAYEESNR